MLVLDETDMLIKRGNRAIDFIMQLSQFKNSRLHLIMVTNLTRQQFFNKLSERGKLFLGYETLTYPAYDREEIKGIIKLKLGDVNIKPDVYEYLLLKAIHSDRDDPTDLEITGDFRKAI